MYINTPGRWLNAGTVSHIHCILAWFYLQRKIIIRTRTAYTQKPVPQALVGCINFHANLKSYDYGRPFYIFHLWAIYLKISIYCIDTRSSRNGTENVYFRLYLSLVIICITVVSHMKYYRRTMIFGSCVFHKFPIMHSDTYAVYRWVTWPLLLLDLEKQSSCIITKLFHVIMGFSVLIRQWLKNLLHLPSLLIWNKFDKQVSAYVYTLSCPKLHWYVSERNVSSLGLPNFIQHFYVWFYLLLEQTTDFGFLDMISTTSFIWQHFISCCNR